VFRSLRFAQNFVRSTVKITPSGQNVRIGWIVSMYSPHIGRYWSLMHPRLAIANFVNFAPAFSLRRDIRPIRRWRSAVFAAGVVLATANCGSDVTPPDDNPIKIASIVINGGPITMERGTTVTVTATVRDTAQRVLTNVPLVWRSTVDTVATFSRDNKLVANLPGRTVITASALGVTSGPVDVNVVWLGAATVAAIGFNPPNAISPGAELPDSIRVVVRRTDGSPAVNARVVFAVTEGGGKVSPVGLVTVGQAGTAAAKWTTGTTEGKNTVTATVVGLDSAPLSYVTPVNPVSFSLKAYNALTIVQGDNQSGNVLAPLATPPIIKLVDSAGKPRAGIPVTFAASHNGRVANSAASTASDGIASPGVWTLGDFEGEQQLVVTVEAAKITLKATATGSTVRFSATLLALAQSATCAVTADQFISCMGQPPQTATADSTKTVSTPTLTKGGIKLTSIAGGGAHFCGTSADLSIYCWGINALVDTLNAFSPGGGAIATYEPTRLQSNIAWVQVTPGNQHNCALANDRSAYCWGIDTSGQLGDNQTARRLVPQPVVGGFKFTTLAAGASHECGVTTTTLAAFCWGLNQNGQLGDGTAANRLTPTAVSGGLRWKAIGAGAAWTCGLIEDGSAYCWGAGTNSQVPVAYATQPAKFKTLSVGTAHACGLSDDGTAYCWGDNSSGQLGDSTTVTRATPTAVATAMKFTAINAGQQQTCGITTDLLVACWGRNTVGEIGLNTPLVQVTPRFVVVGVKP
jgi:alpha-tubulin suppressor-like RCC1 family protein